MTVSHTSRGDLDAEGDNNISVCKYWGTEVGIVLHGVDVPLRREGGHAEERDIYQNEYPMFDLRLRKSVWYLT